MKYDFDEPTQRRGSGSCKWDTIDRENILPLWVADMDFKVSKPILEALEKRVAHGIFGYTHVSDAYYKAINDWFSRRHGLEIRKEWVIYTTGVVPAISAIIKAFTNPGDKILIQTPVYNAFFSSIRNDGCTAAENTLILVPGKDGQPGHYIIDFDDLEKKASDPAVKVMLLCNPHNPAGRVWTREELTRIGEICFRHDVIVVADEIHCELVIGDHAYSPFASISEEFCRRSITCISPSKAFNIAGLQIANIVAEDPDYRARIDKAININEVCDINPFGPAALMAAYNESEDWLLQLLDYLRDNYLYMKTFCEAELPEFPIAELEGTYLVWMDCRRLGLPSEELERQLVRDARLWLNAGTMYGAEGEGFMRWNIACPRAVVRDGLERFRRFVRQRKP